ncbi:MAG: VOC family protein [Maricaulaceae bacterium]|jgi:hypothetical protein
MSTARTDYVELWSSGNPEMKAFYETAFGWRFTDYADTYCGFEDGVREGEAGGFNANGPRTEPLVVLYADDIEAARAGVLKAGGELVGDDVEFPGGKRFAFRDPSGNLLAVWTKSES